MGITTKHRTQEPEIMDDFSLEGEELRDALDKIASINQLLGGNKLTLEGVEELLKKTNTTKTITIADVGCGNGDMLRMLSVHAKKHSLRFKLIGIDANQFTVNYAEKLSKDFPDIEYKCIDIFKDEFATLKYDIVLCTLTLHHFRDEEILKIMTTFNRNASTGVVINDLHRSKIAYRLFEMLCRIFALNRMSREDGLVSILRGFKKEELQAFAKKLNIKNSSIRWRWAFRYQWVISKV
ncbi:methyltransferase [Flavobacterium album]|uniref:Methyltransferase n=1 Tax=Flavobacterium album TaxID=2175091 RepID=A0A2S1R0I4_9FLAO|nr:methyltransferase domain-containing protein [Flavobacterium album]AWH86031.1 methyltransferase [Flavobacterium album]